MGRKRSNFTESHAAFLVFILLFFPLVDANVSSSTTTWRSGSETAYTMKLFYPLCAASTGSQVITATVKGILFNQIQTDATVFATIRKPDSTTTDINFTSNGDGTYDYNFNFDQNGTFFIQAHAYNGFSGAKGDVNGYRYIKDLNWTTAFLNNNASLNAGDLGTIRNTATNIDNNRVLDINVNTTIYYPNSTVFDANASMTQSSTGEFTYSFFAPTTSGTYTVASIFKCDSLYDFNNAGRFTVAAAGGGGGAGEGEIGGGAGGGGGAGKLAQIISVTFKPSLSRNSPSQMNAKIQNLTSKITDYVFEYILKSPSGQLTLGEKEILDVGPFNITEVFIDTITPLELGDYNLIARLKSLDKKKLYDTYIQSYPMQGTHSLAIDVQPTSLKTALGLTFPFTINLLNNGDFTEENIQVTWYILGPEGNEYVRSTFSTSLNPNQTKSLPYSPFIPLQSKIGLHELTVEVTAYNVTQTKKIMFTVVSPQEYYAQLIADLELRIDQLQEKIRSLQQRGFDVTEVKLMLLDIQTDLAKAKGMFLAGNYENLNQELLDLSAAVTRLAAMIDALEQQAPLLSREGLLFILYAGALLLLLLFLWLLRKLLQKKTKPSVGTKISPRLLPTMPWLDRLLDIVTCYYPKKKRKTLKHKPLIDELLKLKE